MKTIYKNNTEKEFSEKELFDVPFEIPHEFEIIDLQREIIKAKDETISLLKVIIKQYSNQNKEKEKKTNETT